MSDDIDVHRAAVVLEIEVDLVEFQGRNLQRSDPTAPSLWPAAAKRLWWKVFQVSGTPHGAPEPPTGLHRELATLGSPRQAAIHLVASAHAHFSGRSIDVEARDLEQHLTRFLDTPAGRDRKAYIDRTRNS